MQNKIQGNSRKCKEADLSYKNKGKVSLDVRLEFNAKLHNNFK